MTDFDGPGRGIAVINAPTTTGRWQFTTNGGTNWANIGVVTGDPARLLAANAQTRIRFVPNLNFTGQASVRYRGWDQIQGASGAKFTITATGGATAFSIGTTTATIVVNPINNAPVLGGISGNVGYVRNDPAFVLAATATVDDVDSANFAAGELRVRITGTTSSANRLIIGGGFTINANNKVLLGATIIGTRNSDGVGTHTLLVTFNANATKAIVQQLTRSIRFRTVNGEVGPRNVLFSVKDGDGGSSLVRTRVVNVT